MKLITFNGTQQQTTSDTLAELLQRLQANTSQSAVAVNQNFVPRSQYAQTLINDGDYIELLTPMQGG